MGRNRRASVLVAALFLTAVAGLAGVTACGTILGIHPDNSAPPGADGGETDAAPTPATGDACIFDDPGSKFSDVCGFGP
ncbi:MAG: hypothetical protein JWO86_3769 [Myxococcaceae bacterium]|jgi:hypothetical protein|nr:hypothetical protein [Myxococcaceae bacterium]MEA2751550.1 hypothetical protein [Myxococcales bacterium]